MAQDTVALHRPWRVALRVVRWLFTALVLGVVVLALVLAVSVRHAVNGETTMFGHPVYSVASGSMTPTFDTGDLIVDNPISGPAALTLHPGQVITFVAASGDGKEAGLVVTHRIVARVLNPADPGSSPVEYRTKGDANNAPDVALVPASAVLGVYHGERIPFGGYVLAALHQPITFVVLILIPVAYIAEELIRRQWLVLGDRAGQQRDARGDGRPDARWPQ